MARTRNHHTLAIFILVLFARAVFAANLSTIYTFPSVYYISGLAVGNDGLFYGVTTQGGTNNLGTVFSLNSAGLLTTLTSFNGSNGSAPQAELVPGNDGNLYGTTYSGGASNKGTIFSVSPAGVLTTLVAFNGTNGNGPQAALIQASDHYFYGGTYRGGTNGVVQGGYGTIFKMSAAGNFTSLVSFRGYPAEGSHLYSPLVQGADGYLYGVTADGGSFDDGTVFKMTTNGLYTTLFSFHETNGHSPRTLALGNDGNLYGTTATSDLGNNGTVFKITTNGILTTLIKFNGTNGMNPLVGLVKGSDGNFYGTAYGGGLYNNGTAFKITSDGNLTLLASFAGNYEIHASSLVQGNDGNFYGTITYPSPNGGSVFKLDVNSPVIKNITGIGTSTVVVTWDALSGRTYQLQSAADLKATNWTPVVPNVTATNSSASVTNGPGGSTNQFYRVMLLP